MRVIAVLFLAVGLAGCAGQAVQTGLNAGRPFSSFENMIRFASDAGSTQNVAAGHLAATDKDAFVACQTRSMVDGVPSEARSAILNGVNSGSDVDGFGAAAYDWIPMPEGHPRRKESAVQRVRNNASRYCPDLLAKYPWMVDYI